MAVHCITLEDLLDLRLSAGGLDLSSRRRVLTDLAGTHLSGFRGRGMEFEEHRRYVAGDDIRSIDWRVTARTGLTHVRSYREERERPVLIATDLRAPMWFGSRVCFKSVLAARAAALFAWAASANGDRVGGLRFDAQHSLSRPAGGRRGAMRLFQLLCAPRLSSAPDLPLHTAIQELRRLSRPGALIIFLSDFQDLDPAARQGLQMLSRHCELIMGMVSDPLERQAPPAGRYPGQGRSSTSASGTAHASIQWLDTRNASLRTQWQTQYQAREQYAREVAVSCRAHWLELHTETPLEQSISAHFGQRRAS